MPTVDLPYPSQVKKRINMANDNVDYNVKFRQF